MLFEDGDVPLLSPRSRPSRRRLERTSSKTEKSMITKPATPRTTYCANPTTRIMSPSTKPQAANLIRRMRLDCKVRPTCWANLGSSSRSRLSMSARIRCSCSDKGICVSAPLWGSAHPECTWGRLVLAMARESAGRSVAADMPTCQQRHDMLCGLVGVVAPYPPTCGGVMSPQDELRSLLDRLPDRERTAVMQFASRLAGGHQARTDLIEALQTMNDE